MNKKQYVKEMLDRLNWMRSDLDEKANDALFSCANTLRKDPLKYKISFAEGAHKDGLTIDRAFFVLTHNGEDYR